jgi:hypothetical protein
MLQDPFMDDLPGPKDNSLVVMGHPKDNRRQVRGQTAEGNRRKLPGESQKNRNLSKKEQNTHSVNTVSISQNFTNKSNLASSAQGDDEGKMAKNYGVY